MQMPLMIDIRKAFVFGGERGEGLQKTQKLACFADELFVIPEAAGIASEILIPAGQPSELREKLILKHERRVPVLKNRAEELIGRGDAPSPALDDLIRGASFVVSDLEDEELNKRLYAACLRLGVICTVVDTKPYCTAWFMSLVETENMIAAISSKGRCAFLSARIREELQTEFEGREPLASLLVEMREELRQKEHKIPKLIEGLGQLYRDSGLRRMLRGVKGFRNREKARVRAHAILQKKGYL